MRADVVDIEHRADACVAVGVQPRGNGGIDLRDQMIFAPERAARHRDLRQVNEILQKLRGRLLTTELYDGIITMCYI